ncbi:hypothetical protein PINS_up012714 [Pythium insidiosum]|nr:hypothetical protein PINS_up012714 [Pythium insidiosum]
MNLVYECLGDMGIIDRVGDLMQKKIREFQRAQYAKENPPPTVAFVSPRQQRRSQDALKIDEGFICGSNSFLQTAAFSSSYEGQVGRESFRRKNMFEPEDAHQRDRFDIFGKPKQPPSPRSAPIERRGDAIDSLLSTGRDPVSSVASGRSGQSVHGVIVSPGRHVGALPGHTAPFAT